MADNIEEFLNKSECHKFKKMQITIPVGGKKTQMPVRGQVLAVHPFTSDHNEFLVHFIFDKELDQETLMSILG